jgi:hypothetical protein
MQILTLEFNNTLILCFCSFFLMHSLCVIIIYLSMQYFHHVCFKVQGTTREVFVDDVVDTTLANQGVLRNNMPMM